MYMAVEILSQDDLVMSNLFELGFMRAQWSFLRLRT